MNRKKPFYDVFEDITKPVSFVGMVYGLLKDIGIAAKIAQCAKPVRLGVHNTDRAETLLTCIKERKPNLIILDWDTCEAEAFKALKEMKQNADLNSVMIIGYVTGAKTVLQEEAKRAGCHRVYPKTEFMRELPTVVARCVV